jgi:hypothetical protein
VKEQERPEWPKHPDGRPKKMGELTKAEQAAQVKAALVKIETELSSSAAQEAFRDKN